MLSISIIWDNAVQAPLWLCCLGWRAQNQPGTVSAVTPGGAGPVRWQVPSTHWMCLVVISDLSGLGWNASVCEDECSSKNANG